MSNGSTGRDGPPAGGGAAAFIASAPGKLVILGDYAVLAGAAAIVAAVDRRALACFVPHAASFWRVCAPSLGIEAHLALDRSGAMPPAPALPPGLGFVEAVLRHVWQRARRSVASCLPFGTLTVRTGAFFVDGAKLGLGSSAAVSCATWTALWAAAAHASSGLVQPQCEEVVGEVVAIHHAVQGGVGSGIDIAASFLGGMLHGCGRQKHVAPRLSPLPPCTGLTIVPVWSGKAAQTAPRLRAFGRLATRRPKAYAACCAALAAASQAGIAAWRRNCADGVLQAVRDADAGLRALGTQMGASIVTAAHRRIAAQVHRAGAAYKPSGAGGGDLGLAVCRSPDQAARVLSYLAEGHEYVVPMAFGARGVRLRACGRPTWHT